MTNAYQYQHTFNDELAKEFRAILSLEPVFDPAEFGELVLWLDADDPQTITLAGSKISNWQSKIAALFAAQGTSLNQPEYVTNALAGRAVLRFSGNQWLVLNSSAFLDAPCTMFIVCKVNDPTSSSSQSIITRQSGAANGGVMFRKSGSGSSNMEVQQVDAASPYPTAMVAIDNQWNIYSTKIQTSAAPIISRNGGADVSAANSPSGFVNDANLPAVIGVAAFNFSASQFSGDLAEILVYRGIISESNITSIEEYLTNKWGII